MQVIQDALRSPDLPYGCVLTIGNYDGIHLGQRSVVEKVVQRGRERGSQGVVLTFDPHPVSVLRPDETPPRLTLDRQREELLAAAGLDALLVVRFTREFAETTADSFVREFLHRRLAVEEVYVGEDFVFGRDREGDIDLLEEIGEELGFEAHGIPAVTFHGEVVSSTRIRQAIREGDVEKAMDLLGRPYSICGEIVRGDRMGKRLGWPTINVQPENEHLPSDGVYACRVRFPSMPATFDCVTNVGTRPTVYENYTRVVESHILGFSADVYGETVELLFYKRLRAEKLFPSVMDLSAQIARDVETTREFFATRRRLQEGGLLADAGADV